MHFADKQQDAIPFSLIQIFFLFLRMTYFEKTASVMHDVSNRRIFRDVIVTFCFISIHFQVEKEASARTGFILLYFLL